MDPGYGYQKFIECLMLSIMNITTSGCYIPFAGDKKVSKLSGQVLGVKKN